MFLAVYICFWLIVFICIAAYVDWATEPFQRQLHKLRKKGLSWEEIGERYGVTGDCARRWAGRKPVRGNRDSLPPIPDSARLRTR